MKAAVAEVIPSASTGAPVAVGLNAVEVVRGLRVSFYVGEAPNERMLHCTLLLVVVAAAGDAAAGDAAAAAVAGYRKHFLVGPVTFVLSFPGRGQGSHTDEVLVAAAVVAAAEVATVLLASSVHQQYFGVTDATLDATEGTS